MNWDESIDCPVMFEHEPAGEYGVDRLFRYDSGRPVSRNLPHCMPVWRRELHYKYGFFDEKRYGPSADWEFWLRCAMHGERFALLDEPMGLYLKHENSYWRRKETDSYEQRIINEYADLSRKNILLQRKDHPLSQRISEAIKAHSCEDELSLYCTLTDCFLHERSHFSKKLIDRLAEQSPGIPSFYRLMQENISLFLSMDDPVQNALHLIISVIHCCSTNQIQALSESFLKALDKHYHTTRRPHSLIAKALLHRKLRQPDDENKFLALAFSLDTRRFWSALADVYRFEITLQPLAQSLTPIQHRSSTASNCSDQIRIWFYPVYSSNKYTRLLYQKSVEQGAFVEGIIDLNQFSGLEADPGYQNVIHLHWINEFVESSDGRFPQEKAYSFLNELDRLQQDGFEIRWTVHNRLSHHSVDEEKELAFRTSLYELADRVYLHHPMALSLLDWIPDGGRKCSLVEHGNYLSILPPGTDKTTARQKLGFAEDDFILLYIGLLRDYKGIDEFLPVIDQLASKHRRLRLVVAGRVDSDAVQQTLDTLQSDNIFIHGAYLSDDELGLYMDAADMGFLSYKEVLTSGTLYHLLSGGLPVIGPDRGTIASYIAHGWNGFVYNNMDELEKIIQHCCQLPSEQMAKMGINALSLAKSLSWNYH